MIFKQPNPSQAKPPLRIITLSGTESVTKNLTVYEYGDDIIIVDCGVGIPDSDMLGVNVVIPDFTYLIENKHKIKGLFITHGHEDHIGAIPYFLQDFDVPIYAGKLVQGFLMERLKDRTFKGLDQKVRFNLMEEGMPEVMAGVFRVSAFRVNHSVPSSTGLAINTPEGLVLHMADYKIDFTPVLDKPIDLGRIAEYGDKGVLCLLSDCLGVTTEGYSKSESTLKDTFTDLFDYAGKRQVFVTTISSNISRMFQIISASIKYGRRVVLAGRSIDQSVTVARKLGYLTFDDAVFVKDSEAASYPQSDLVYLIAGCYGQQGSALDRVSRHEHDNISLEKDALVIFSADPNPPGVELDVEKVMANLTTESAEVIYSKIQDNLHVSGHGTRGDLTTVAAISKAKYYIPLGGTITRMRAYTNMIGDLGRDKKSVFECREGESVEFLAGHAKRGSTVETKPVFIDSTGASEINPVVIRDRGQLSTDGVFVVVIPASRDGKYLTDRVEVITRGFIYVKESQALMEKSKKFVGKSLDKNIGKSKDWPSLKRKLEYEIGDFLQRETRRNPLIIVHSILI